MYSLCGILVLPVADFQLDGSINFALLLDHDELCRSLAINSQAHGGLGLDLLAHLHRLVGAEGDISARRRDVEFFQDLPKLREFEQQSQLA